MSTVADTQSAPASTTTEHPAIERVGVIGGGQMGAGIAEVAIRSGVDVILVEANQEAADRASARIEASIQRAVKRGKVEQDVATDALDRLATTTSIEDLVDRQLTVEAVVEDKDAKLGVAGKLATILDDPDAIIASNTSSIPIVEIAASVGDRGKQVLGLHFFNPVPVLRLVEVIPSLLTAPETTDRATAFARDVMGREPILAPDRAGFTVNALLIPYLLSAIRMLDQGLATAGDIDDGMVKGCAHPMGPLALSDLIGLDTVLAIAETLYAEQREQLFAPPPLLQRMVSAGRLGRKTGAGFYPYEQG